MSAAISFTPRHSQPFTLEQAMALEVDMLVTEITRLQNSIAHLRATQDELEAFIRDDPDGDGDEDGELGKAMRENEQVIASQAERVTLIKIALLNKVGEGGVKHMGLEVSAQEMGSVSAAETRGGGGRGFHEGEGDVMPNDSSSTGNTASHGPTTSGRATNEVEDGIFL